MNKRGNLIIGLVLIIIAGVLLVSLFAGLNYGLKQFRNELKDVGDLGVVNFTSFSEITVDKMVEAFSFLRIMAFGIIVMLCVGVIITSAVIDTRPYFFIIFLMVVIGLFIGSTYIANEYEILLGQGLFNGEMMEFREANFFILNLPIVVAVVGLISIFFLLIKVDRSDEGEVVWV